MGGGGGNMFDDLARMATFREVGGDVVTGIV